MEPADNIPGDHLQTRGDWLSVTVGFTDPGSERYL